MCKVYSSSTLFSDLDSEDGIRVTPENPNSNLLFLNVEHPAVLRQYYGCDLLPAPINSYGNKIMNRYLYAISAGTISVGTDPAQFLTRKIVRTMDLISKDLNKLLIHNVEFLNLSSADLTQ